MATDTWRAHSRIAGRHRPKSAGQPSANSIFNFSALADGERRRLNWIGGVASERSRRDASLGTFRSAHGSSALAVGMLRDMKKKTVLGRMSRK